MIPGASNRESPLSTAIPTPAIPVYLVTAADLAQVHHDSQAWAEVT
jgi:hypothetical protein